MTSTRYNWLPELVHRKDGEPEAVYIDRLYALFCSEWIVATQEFNGLPIKIKRHPPYDGLFADKHATFRHIITEGPDEQQRAVDPLRCQRIHWPLALLKMSQHEDVLYWQNRRMNGIGHVFALSDFSFKLVLAERSNFLLLWTAYPVQGSNQRRKNEREYEDYISQNS